MKYCLATESRELTCKLNILTGIVWREQQLPGWHLVKLYTKYVTMLATLVILYIIFSCISVSFHCKTNVTWIFGFDVNNSLHVCMLFMKTFLIWIQCLRWTNTLLQHPHLEATEQSALFPVRVEASAYYSSVRLTQGDYCSLYEPGQLSKCFKALHIALTPQRRSSCDCSLARITQPLALLSSVNHCVCSYYGHQTGKVCAVWAPLETSSSAEFPAQDPLISLPTSSQGK